MMDHAVRKRLTCQSVEILVRSHKSTRAHSATASTWTEKRRARSSGRHTLNEARYLRVHIDTASTELHVNPSLGLLHHTLFKFEMCFYYESERLPNSSQTQNADEGGSQFAKTKNESLQFASHDRSSLSQYTNIQTDHPLNRCVLLRSTLRVCD